MFEYLRMFLFMVIFGWVYVLCLVFLEKYKVFIIKKVRWILYFMVFVGMVYFLLQYIVLGINKIGNFVEIWKIYVFFYMFYWYLFLFFWVFLVVGLLDVFKWLDKFGYWVIWIVVVFVLLLVRDIVILEVFFNYLSYKGGIYLFFFFMIGVGIQCFKGFFGNVWFNCVLAVVFIVGLAIQ